MKYMMMMNASKKDWQSFGTMAPEEIKAHINFMMKLNEQLKASGELVDTQGLTGPEQAKIVRSRPGGGAPAVTDGPFPEAKEFLAGYWLIEVSSPERGAGIAGGDGSVGNREPHPGLVLRQHLDGERALRIVGHHDHRAADPGSGVDHLAAGRAGHRRIGVRRRSGLGGTRRDGGRSPGPTSRSAGHRTRVARPQAGRDESARGVDPRAGTTALR